MLHVYLLLWVFILWGARSQCYQSVCVIAESVIPSAPLDSCSVRARLSSPTPARCLHRHRSLASSNSCRASILHQSLTYTKRWKHEGNDLYICSLFHQLNNCNLDQLLLLQKATKEISRWFLLSVFPFHGTDASSNHHQGHKSTQGKVTTPRKPCRMGVCVSPIQPTL